MEKIAKKKKNWMAIFEDSDAWDEKYTTNRISRLDTVEEKISDV